MKSQELIKKVLSLVDSEDKNRIKLIILLMILSMLIEIISLSVLIQVIDFQNKYDKIVYFIKYYNLEIETNKQHLFFMLIIFVVIIYIIKFIFLTYSSWFQTRFIADIQKKLSQKLFKKYINLNYEKFISKNTSTLLNNVIREVNLLVGGGISPFLILISEFIIVLSILIMFIFANPFSAIFLIIFFGTIISISVYITKNKLKIWGQRRLNSDIKRTKILQMALYGYKELKTYNTESFFLKKYATSNEETANMMQLQNFTQQLPRLILEIFSIIGLMILIFILVMTIYIIFPTT